MCAGPEVPLLSALRGCAQGPRILLEVFVFFQPEDAGPRPGHWMSSDLTPDSPSVGAWLCSVEDHSRLLIMQCLLKHPLQEVALPDRLPRQPPATVQLPGCNSLKGPSSHRMYHRILIYLAPAGGVMGAGALGSRDPGPRSVAETARPCLAAWWSAQHARRAPSPRAHHPPSPSPPNTLASFLRAARAKNKGAEGGKEKLP